MMTATFDRTIEGIQEEIQIDDFGRGKASIRATARLAGVSHVALIKAFEGGNLNPSGLAVKNYTGRYFYDYCNNLTPNPIAHDKSC